ncbi:hypothetical protein GEMRC1_002953 [Eukaryota sp. GEM-RC1]
MKAQPPPLSSFVLGAHIPCNKPDTDISDSSFQQTDIPLTLMVYTHKLDSSHWKLLQDLDPTLPTTLSATITYKDDRHFIYFSNRSRLVFSVPIDLELLLSFFDCGHLLLYSPSLPFLHLLPHSFIALRFDSSLAQKDFLDTVLSLQSHLPYLPRTPSAQPHADRSPGSLVGDPSFPTIYGYSLTWSRRDPLAPRGCRVKGLAVTGCYYNLLAFKAPLREALTKVFEDLTSVEHERSVVKSFYASLVDAGFACSPELPPFSLIPPVFLMENLHVGSSCFHQKMIVKKMTGRSLAKSCSMTWNDVSFDLSFPQLRYPDEVIDGDLSTLLLSFKHSFMKLYNAIISGQTVVLICPNHPATSCCCLVLSLVQLFFPLRGFIQSKVFPFSTLINQSYLDFPGSITSTNNPMYLAQKDWYDVLGNVNTGEIHYGNHQSSKILKLSQTNTWDSEDNDFIDRILKKILSGNATNEWIRQCFHVYTTRLLLFCQAKPTSIDDSQGFQRNEKRCVGMKATWQYCLYHRDLYYYNQSRSASVDFDPLLTLIRTHCKVSRLSRFPEVELLTKRNTELVDAFLSISAAITDSDSLIEFLSVATPVRGGLSCFALGMFHSDSCVRESVVSVLKKVSSLKDGSKYLRTLSQMSLVAFEKLKD